MGNYVKAMLSDDVGLKVDRSTGEVTIIARKHGHGLIEKSIGGLNATVADSYAVVDIDGKQYALLQIEDGSISANLVPRTGTTSQLATIDGSSGEIAVASDKPTICILSGTANGAKFINSWGSTKVIPSPEIAGPTITLEPSARRLIFTGSVGQSYTLQNGYEEGQVIELHNNMIGSDAITLTNTSISIPNGILYTLMYNNGTWKALEFRYIGSAGAGLATNNILIGSEVVNGIYDDCVVIGNQSAAENAASIAIGKGATTMFDNSITTGRGRSARNASKHEFMVGGVTSTSNQTRVLAFNGIGDEVDGEQPWWIGGVNRVTVTIMGRRSNSSDWVRFVRKFDMYVSNAGVHTLANVITPTDEPDYRTAGMTGTNVAFSNGTYGLNITVTAPNTAMTTVWTAFVETKFLKS